MSIVSFVDVSKVFDNTSLSPYVLPTLKFDLLRVIVRGITETTSALFAKARVDLESTVVPLTVIE